MNKVYINSLSVIAPGLMGLEQAMPVLRGERSWQRQAMQKIVPDLLPANERRRTTALIKLAMKAGQDAVAESGHIDEVNTVFASSEGDLEITDKICTALTLEDKPVSPTLFHNSVHNAAAGYWAIAARYRKPSVSMAAGDATFAAGLLEAVSQILMDHESVLYVAYDYPAPHLLDAQRHFELPFATAMLLSEQPSNESLASFTLQVEPSTEVSSCVSNSLEPVRAQNPIARSLPMLEAICRQQPTRILLPYLGVQVVSIDLCP